MKKLRIGVLSTAKIGLQQVIPAMQQGRLTDQANMLFDMVWRAISNPGECRRE